MRNLHLVLAFSLAAAAGANGDARARTSVGATPPGNHYGWCKGNGNPHSSGCATSTNGGTVNGNTGHAPPPTATEVPHPAGIVTGTYGQSFTGYAPVPPIPPQLTPQQPPPLAAPPLAAPPLLPGYVQFPNYQGTRDPATGFPAAVPPQQVTGTYAPPVVGYAPVPPIPPQLTPPQPPPLAAPPLLPGYVQFPNYQGTRDPATGLPAAVPPQQVVGTYAPPVIGYAPVPPIPPQHTPPQPPPQSAPPMVQKPVPKPMPTQAAGATPGDVTVHAADQRAPLAGQMIPRHAGRQHPNAQPRFEIAGTGEAWTCVASGFQRRRHVDETGAVSVSGVLPNLAMVEGLIRDIPAFHEHRAECLVGVQLRPEHAARGSARPRN
jgi:hypothetical protein